jgi:hypothetical protein
MNEQPASDHLRVAEVEHRFRRVEALARRSKHALNVSRAKVAPCVRQVLDVKSGLLADLERDVGRGAQAVGGMDVSSARSAVKTALPKARRTG